MRQSHDDESAAIAERPVRARRPRRSGPELRQRRRRLVQYALIAVGLVLTLSAVVGENGYLAALRAERQRAALQSEVMSLRRTNQALKEQARRLKDDPAAIEEAARRDLGLIKPGETLVIVRDAHPPVH
jgi:cell division protein FtsB